jgi:hypothetical protein
LRALEHGFRIKVAEVASASIEVDTPSDLERARAALRAANDQSPATIDQRPATGGAGGRGA